MRVLVFHGYLLAGTGSNVYNARLAAALVREGHEVHLFAQERRPEEQPFVDAVGDWDGGELSVRVLREPVRCTAYRPDIGGLLPVYVRDRYEGVEARTFAECSDEELDAYVRANADAVREVAEAVGPEVALANHLVMGPAILARALASRQRRERGGEPEVPQMTMARDGAAAVEGEASATTWVPYAVKIHGSALEYTVKPQPERFLAYAREGVDAARAVLVGSRHTAASLWQALGAEGSLRERTRLGPPGVDVALFRPLEEHGAGGVGELVGELAGVLRARAPAEAPATAARESAGAFTRDARAAAGAIERIDADDRLVAFVGKLIVSKGVDLLLGAWPFVLERVPRARLVVVGFGAFREALERLTAAIAAGELAEARRIARLGRSLEGGEAQPLHMLLAFLEGLGGSERDRYLRAAREFGERVLFTGRLEHDELALLLPACEAVVVPSTFPESFGMIAAEAAACGALPISAAHSGLEEVSAALAAAVPHQAARALSFPLDDDPVRGIAERVLWWLDAAPELRRRTRRGLVEVVRERLSWEGVARGVIEAASGDLERLPHP